MSQTFSNIIGTFVIASGTNVAPLISGSSFTGYGSVTFYTTGSLTGVAAVRLQPDTGSFWYNFQDENVAISLTPGSAVLAKMPAFTNMQLSASLPQSHSANIVVYGEYNTEAKVLPM